MSQERKISKELEDVANSVSGEFDYLMNVVASVIDDYQNHICSSDDAIRILKNTGKLTARKLLKICRRPS